MTQSVHNDDANLLELTHTIKDKVMGDINCHNVGRIVSFDETTQTATIELMQVKQFQGENYLPTVITNVPLIIYGGGTGHITYPDPTGTLALLFIMDRNIDNFLETGEQYVPNTTRMHSFTDCVAITTFKTLANPLNDYDKLAVSILNEVVIESVPYWAYHKVYGNSIKQKVWTKDEEGNETSSTMSLTPTENSVNASQAIDLQAGQTISIQSVSGGIINVTDLLQLKNATYSLATLIATFLTACEGITTVTGGSLTPASKQAFTDLKTQFGGLLKP